MVFIGHALPTLYDGDLHHACEDFFDPLRIRDERRRGQYWQGEWESNCEEDKDAWNEDPNDVYLLDERLSERWKDYNPLTGEVGGAGPQSGDSN